MAWYGTGTISLTNGSGAVTGSGTNFIANAAVGEGMVAPDGRLYEITAIASSTSLTISPVYAGSTASGQAYKVAPTQSYIRDLAASAAELVNDFASVRDNAGAGQFGDGTVSAPGMRFTADPDTGIRRGGTNSLSLVAGGADIANVGSSGVDVAGRVTTTGAVLGGTTSALIVGGITGTHALTTPTEGEWALVVRHTGVTTPYGIAISFSGSAPNGAGSQAVYFRDNDGEKFMVRSSGTTSNATGTYGTISDAKIKFVVGPVSSQWDDTKAMAQAMCKYRLIADGADGPVMLGWVAQDLQAIAPGLVEAVDDFDIVDTGELNDDGGPIYTRAPRYNEDGTPSVTLHVKTSVALLKGFAALGEIMERIEASESALAAALARIDTLEAA